MNVETDVLSRYSEAAKQKSAELCCPIDYDASLLKILPKEIIDRDYGCGDPSRYVKPGDTVLDLGSGGGKICYMAAQIIGRSGKIIGIDMNDDMLALARKHQSDMAEKLGYDSVEFRKGYIQDLGLDLEVLERHLSTNPVASLSEHRDFETWQQKQRSENPLVANNSVDLVISNCVLNLVDDREKRQLIEEIFRVVKPGGRIAISDIVSDEAIPSTLKKNENLWTGCISGAFQERSFLDDVSASGFVGARYDQWSIEPWQVVEGIEFRSVTLTATKPISQIHLDRGHAVIYRGPYSKIHDDQGNFYVRGERIAVSDSTYELLTKNLDFQNDFIDIAPEVEKTPSDWVLPGGSVRPASESKGSTHGRRLLLFTEVLLLESGNSPGQYATVYHYPNA